LSDKAIFAHTYSHMPLAREQHPQPLSRNMAAALTHTHTARFPAGHAGAFEGSSAHDCVMQWQQLLPRVG
jgi:hypothetical protein